MASQVKRKIKLRAKDFEVSPHLRRRRLRQDTRTNLARPRVPFAALVSERKWLSLPRASEAKALRARPSSPAPSPPPPPPLHCAPTSSDRDPGRRMARHAASPAVPSHDPRSFSSPHFS